MEIYNIYNIHKKINTIYYIFIIIFILYNHEYNIFNVSIFCGGGGKSGGKLGMIRARETWAH
jgi:hypothetical protein